MTNKENNNSTVKPREDSALEVELGENGRMIYKNLKQNTPEWFELRRGKLTGSKMNTLIKTRASAQAGATESMAFKLLAETFSYNYEDPKLTAQTYFTALGHEGEEIAVKLYETINNVTLDRPGFITVQDTILGLSPDALLKTKKGYIKGIEVKALGGDNFVQWFIYRRNNKIPKDYLWQVVMYFLVIEEMESLDFCLLNMTLDESIQSKISPLHVITITRAELEKEIEQAKEIINNVNDLYKEIAKEFIDVGL